MLAALLLAAVAIAQAVPSGSRGGSPTTYPAVPTGLTCEKATSTSITISWKGSTDGIHLYDLEAGTTVSTAETFPFASVTVSAKPLSYATIDELKPGTDYFFKVRAHSASAGGAQMIAG